MIELLMIFGGFGAGAIVTRLIAVREIKVWRTIASKYADRLIDISKMETGSANATVRRMAAKARGEHYPVLSRKERSEAAKRGHQTRIHKQYMRDPIIKESMGE